MNKFDDVWNFLPHISIYQIRILTAMSSMAIIGGLWLEISKNNFDFVKNLLIRNNFYFYKDLVAGLWTI